MLYRVFIGYLSGLYQGREFFSGAFVPLKSLSIRKPYAVGYISKVFALEIYHAQNFFVVLMLKIAVLEVCSKLVF